ncbi:MAG: NifU family protein [Anaerovoracaceae bacterium]
METENKTREILDKVQKILDEKVNPQLALHNGSAGATDFDCTTKTAYIKFYGACASCMSSSDTFENLIEKEILSACPDVKEVLADDSVSEELLEMARKILNKEL